ncbi:MAG TPA: Rrf2 family transcriptional regulator [Burkholderiales bacterium]|nr:Rrf2 family transcriptional regulator [Burkholderiales bacterium]
MRLNTFTEYSLRVLLYVAAAAERRTTIAEIARAFRVSEHHLVKVVHFLGREGFLDNMRGQGGGLRLARAASEINVGEVTRLAEAGDMPAECFDRRNNRCVLAGGCRLQGVLREAVESFYGTLSRYSVADLEVRPAKLRALLRAA